MGMSLCGWPRRRPATRNPVRRGASADLMLDPALQLTSLEMWLAASAHGPSSRLLAFYLIAIVCLAPAREASPGTTINLPKTGAAQPAANAP